MASVEADESEVTAVEAGPMRDDDSKSVDDVAIAEGEDEEAGTPAKAKPVELTDQTNLLPRRQLVTVFAALSAATALAFLDQTIVATALPDISSHFAAGKLSTWVATSYLLASTACLPIYGRLSDIVGRKIVLLTGLAIFNVASLACALSQSMIQLIVFRAFQGVGGGSILSVVLIVMSDVVTLRERGKYSGIIEAVIALSNGVGPLLGGVLTDKASWRWCFWINLPLCSAVMLTIFFFLPQKRVEGDAKTKLKRIDYLGSCLTLAASILILMPLNWGGVTQPWSSAAVIATLIVGGVLVVAFVLWEAKGPRVPILPMSIFRYPTVVGVLIVTTFNGYCYYDVLFFIPQFFQVTRGDSPLRSGVLLLPFVVTPATTVWATGMLVSRGLDYRIPILTGFALAAIGLGLLSTLNGETSTARMVGYMLISGLGFGATFQNTLIAAQAASPRPLMAVVTSVRNFMRSVGGVIGLALATTTINNTLRSRLSLPDEVVGTILDDPTAIWRPSSSLSPSETSLVIDAYIEGFFRLFVTLASLTAASFFVCLVLVRKEALDRQDDKDLKAEAKRRLAEKRGRQQAQ